ncbi:hypothetical protein [Sporichthya polymorpha]|uniref:hypothetical protein n=1 Tax=Sporichthya polymorpha TaxID=35751 RepID=UPI000366CF2A|nr:hypothetical protein [Sporichthya polymorpha]
MKIATRCGVTAGMLGVLLGSAPVVAGSAQAAELPNTPVPTTAAGPCPAARVTGFSALLDALSTGSVAGPSVVYGIALAALSQPLPDPLGTAQAQFLAQGAQGVQQLRTEAPGYIDQVRAVIAPFAAGNEMANQGVDAFADGLDALADTGGKAIAPGDLTLRQIAVLVRTARENPSTPCSTNSID